MVYQLNPIGIIRSPFKEKFGIPRQPRLAPHAFAQLEMLPPYNNPAMFSGLQAFSHIWLSFIFHQTVGQGWKPQVRPPRLGGNKKVGVFASRSTFRPNATGLSAVKLIEIKQTEDKLWLELAGVDLLDGTPVIDIKPYLPYSDAIESAKASFASTAPDSAMAVVFSLPARKQCEALTERYPELTELIIEVLQQDPRPAYKKTNPERQDYAVRLFDLDIKWQVENGKNRVISVEPISS